MTYKQTKLQLQALSSSVLETNKSNLNIIETRKFTNFGSTSSQMLLVYIKTKLLELSSFIGLFGIGLKAKQAKFDHILNLDTLVNQA